MILQMCLLLLKNIGICWKRERTTINQQLRELDDFQKSIQLLYQQRKVYPGLELLELPARQILSYEVKENIHQMFTEEYELYLRYFKDLIQDYFLSLIVLEGWGSSFWRDTLNLGLVSHELFVFPQDMVVLPSTQLKEISGGIVYVVSYCTHFKKKRLLYLFF